MSDDIFNEINFSEVNIDPPVFDNDKMVIKVHNVTLVSGDDYSTRFVGSAFLIFNGVVKSVRTIDEYIGDPKVGIFKDGYIKEDIKFNNDTSCEGKNVYEFEGCLTNPLAWIGSWIVCCESFEFRKAYEI